MQGKSELQLFRQWQEIDQFCCCVVHVRVGIDPHLEQLLLDARVPEVLDLVVSPTRKMCRNLGPPEIYAHMTTHQMNA